MKSSEIRSLFLQFFKNYGHEIVPSHSLIPHNDPTLLFTNAGMNQFKNVFLGTESRPYKKAATVQRCVRAGGKHNDLDNVGYTARHLTFFEMLGNFSFGDYFKREAIKYAWEFLTTVLKLSPEKLWVTVYEEDSEAESIWLNEVQIDPSRFSRLGTNDNFWRMGTTGPCGPCSEIFYDHGEKIPGGPPGSEDADADRYVEIWNMVFMQYDQISETQQVPLPHCSIDTGMGLERIAAVMQNVHSNYEIDIFQTLLSDIKSVLNVTKTNTIPLQVIADHSRSCSFLIADGVMPSNEGRGYVLRRIIRRACRYGHQLGQKDSFLYHMVPSVINVMGEAALFAKKQQSFIQSVLRQEEDQFRQTLEKGLKLLKKDLAQLKGKVLGGDTAFTLYDTYGFPIDLTQDIVREQGITVDMDGYHECMNQQKKRARAEKHFHQTHDALFTKVEASTEFIGYEHLSKQAKIIGLFVDNAAVEHVDSPVKAQVLFDQTPFYAESGGQVSDTGYGDSLDKTTVFEIQDVQNIGSQHVHFIQVSKGSLKLHQQVVLQVDEEKRLQIAANHSATHLLHASLREILGPHVEQKGSLVHADYLRFDFSHFDALKESQINTIQAVVNQKIRENTSVKTKIMPLEEAKAQGVTALFNEKYENEVRVLFMGKNNFSRELCGGTHVSCTGDIGVFLIISESGIAANVRRIEAVTGVEAEKWIEKQGDKLKKISSILKSDPAHILEKIENLKEKNQKFEKEIEKLEKQAIKFCIAELMNQCIKIKNVKAILQFVDGENEKYLRYIVDRLKEQLDDGIVFLAIQKGEKVLLVSGVTKSLKDKVHAGDLLRCVATHIDGQGGGRPDFAQGGGTANKNINKLMLYAKAFIEKS